MSEETIAQLYPHTFVQFTLYGAPQPWQRAGRTKKGVSYTPKETRAYKQSLKNTAWVALRADGVFNGWPLRSLFELKVIVRFEDERRRDLDNVLKSISDAGNGVLWDDDAHIDVKRIERVRFGLPRTEVTVIAIGEVPTPLRKRAVRRAS